MPEYTYAIRTSQGHVLHASLTVEAESAAGVLDLVNAFVRERFGDYPIYVSVTHDRAVLPVFSAAGVVAW